MSDTPHIARKPPFSVDVEAGKTYFRCACGQSAKQPFRDGSHRSSSLNPVRLTAETNKTAWLCGCKQTASAPFCDGSHKAL